MADLAALVIDSEYLDAAIRDVKGKDYGADVVKLRDYIAGVVPGRVLLWTRWYAAERWNQLAEARIKRNRYFAHLNRSGIRVIEVPAKPITKQSNAHEENLCDFAVVHGVELACRAASTVIVATGDGHIADVIRRAHEEHGRRVEIVCDHRSCSSVIEADRFHDVRAILAHSDIARLRPARAKQPALQLA